MEPNLQERPESERLDNAPLHRKFPNDTHIAGAPELRTVVDLGDTDDDEGLDPREELDELEVEATATLAEGMGADDARLESVVDESEDNREPELRTDLDEESQESPDDDAPTAARS